MDICNITENTVISHHHGHYSRPQQPEIIESSHNITMKPYRRPNKTFMVELRLASRLGRVRVLVREFAGDVRSLWRYGAPFPTFLKLIGSLILCLVVILPIVYPIFILTVTYFTFEGLYLSWSLDQPWRFLPVPIARSAIAATLRPARPADMWKVREVLTRGILLTHSLATSVDYLCVMQGLLDEV